MKLLRVVFLFMLCAVPLYGAPQDSIPSNAQCLDVSTMTPEMWLACTQSYAERHFITAPLFTAPLEAIPVHEEATDVPAIETDHAELWDSSVVELLYFAQACYVTGGTMKYDPNPIACHIVTSTCVDKSRILLTGEDGVKHCVKFSTTKPIQW